MNETPENPIEPASTITELRRKLHEVTEEAREWQARYTSIMQLWEALQASHGQLQHDYRRLSTVHAEILLAHGSIVREHAQLAMALHRPAPVTTNMQQSGDAGIEFTSENFCEREGCPTSPPHRHITPTHPLNSPGPGVPPSLDRIITDCTPPPPNSIRDQESRVQATLDDEIGDPDVIPTRANPRIDKQAPVSIDVGPPSFNTSERVVDQGTPVRESTDFDEVAQRHLQSLRRTPEQQAAFEQRAAEILNQAFEGSALQQLQDSARIASKFADASGEAGPHVIDANQEFGIPNSDETSNSPDKGTEQR